MGDMTDDQLGMDARVEASYRGVHRCNYIIEQRRFGRIIDYTRRCKRRVKVAGERCWQHKAAA